MDRPIFPKVKNPNFLLAVPRTIIMHKTRQWQGRYQMILSLKWSHTCYKNVTLDDYIIWSFTHSNDYIIEVRCESGGEEQAAKWLAASLQGDALRLVGDSGQKHPYGELVKLLQRRFGSARQSENYLVELRHRRQKPKESLLELGQAIHELTVRAYPEIQEEAREKLAKNHFIDAVDSHSVREGINRARPKTLDEAVHAALETENFEKVEQHRLLDRKPAKLARALNSDTEQRLETLELSLREQAKTLSSVAEMMKSLSGQTTGQGPGKGASSPKTSQPGRHEPGTFKCFKCKEKGHFARECKKAPKQRNGNQPPVGPGENVK